MMMRFWSVWMVIGAFLLPLQAQMHTYEGVDSIDTIEVRVVYYLPGGEEALPDWKDRVQYHIDRAKAFHAREFSGQSELIIHCASEPFVSDTTLEAMPKDDVNAFFWKILNEVSSAGAVAFSGEAFPILLVMSDHNFSNSYEDWTRVCDGIGCVFEAPHEDCRGHVRDDGDHRPGTRCGGSRAVYWESMHQGFGLISADGWRVPMKGTDCVFYHEGIGHPIGLPHPDPNDDSVMGTAQYVDSIQKTWVNAKQKEKLGWQISPIEKKDLFSTFSIEHSPVVPKADQPIRFYATLPSRFEVESIRLEYQTGLREPFRPIAVDTRKTEGEDQIYRWEHPGLPAGKSMGYRIQVQLADGSSERLWHYLKVE